MAQLLNGHSDVRESVEEVMQIIENDGFRWIRHFSVQRQVSPAKSLTKLPNYWPRVLADQERHYRPEPHYMR